MDLGYLLGDILKSRQLRDNVTVSIFLTTSLFFSAATQPNLRPNTWAALQELDYFMRKRTHNRRRLPGQEPGEMLYFDNHWIATNDAPFQFVYLIDAIDHRGYNIENPVRMTRLVGDVLYLIAASRVGQEAASRVNNVKSLRNIQAGTVYSTAGVASLIVPIDEIIQIASLHLIEQTLQQQFLQAPEIEEDLSFVKTQSGDLTEKVGLSFESLMARMTIDEDTQIPLSRAFRNNDRLRRGQLARIDRRTLHQEVKSRVQDVRPIVERDANRHIHQQCEILLDTFSERFEQAIESILVQRAGGGPRLALEFANIVNDRLDDLRLRIQNEHNDLEFRLDASRDRLNQFDADFQQKTSQRRVIPIGVDPGQEAAERYIAAQQNQIDLTIDRIATEAINTLLGEMKAIAADRRLQLEDLIDRLEQVSTEDIERLTEDIYENISRMDIIRRRPLISTPEEIAPRYQSYMDTIDATDLLTNRYYGESGCLVDLLSMSSLEEVRNQLMDTAAETLSGIRDDPDLFIENIILEREHIEPPTEVLGTLIDQAAHFWQTQDSEAVERDQLEEMITIVGVSEPEESIFSEQLREMAREEGFSNVATFNPHAVTVLSMVHGVAYRTLSQRRIYLHDYERAMSRDEPLHVFPEFTTNKNGNGHYIQQVFTKANAYGIIQSRFGRWTFPDQITDGIEGLLETMSLFDAFWYMVHYPTLAQHVDEAVVAFEQQNKAKTEILVKSLRDYNPEGHFDKGNDDQLIDEGWLANVLKRLSRELANDIERHGI